MLPYDVIIFIVANLINIDACLYGALIVFGVMQLVDLAES